MDYGSIFAIGGFSLLMSLMKRAETGQRGYRWVEWDNVASGVFFSSGWDLMDCGV